MSDFASQFDGVAKTRVNATQYGGVHAQSTKQQSQANRFDIGTFAQHLSNSVVGVAKAAPSFVANATGIPELTDLIARGYGTNSLYNGLDQRNEALNRAINSAQHQYRLDGNRAKLNAAMSDIHGRSQKLQSDREGVDAARPKAADYIMPLVQGAGAAATVLSYGLAAPEVGAAEGALDAAVGGGAALSKLARARAAIKEAASYAKNQGVKQAAGVVGAGKSTSSAANPIVRTIMGAPGKLVRNAIFTQPTIQAASDSAVGLAHGNPIPAAENAALVGLTHGVFKGAPIVGSALKNLTHDSSGIFDRVVLQDGKTVNQHLAEAKQALTDGTTYDGKPMTSNRLKTITDNLKVSEAQNLENHGGLFKASKAITEHQAAHGNPTTEQSLSDFARTQGKLASANRTAVKEAGSGGLFTKDKNGVVAPVDPALIPQVTVGKATHSEKGQVARILSEAFDATPGKNEAANRYGALQSAKDQFPEFFKNPNNSAKVNEILAQSKTPEEVKARINRELTGSGELFNAKGEPVRYNGGYHPTMAKDVVPNFKTPGKVPDITVGTKAPLGIVGRSMAKVGASPLALEGGQFHTELSAKFNDRLANTDIAPKSQKILNELFKATSGTRGVFDPRLFNKGAIEKILADNKVSPGNAGIVRAALDGAFNDLPLSTRGLGPRVTDAVISKVPFSIGRNYIKAQSYGRFGINPFFAVKVITKSSLAAGVESGTFNMFKSVPKDVNAYVSARGGNTFEAIGDHSFLGGEAPNVKPGLVGKVQQQIAGSSVDKFLKTQGATMKDLETNATLRHQVDHIIDITYGYPKGGFLDSNFIKTLNVIVFPARFEAKIASIGVKYLAKQTPIARAVMVNNLLHAGEWLDSSDGQKWQKDNAELVGIMNYFTPTHTLGEFYKVATGQATHVSDLGAIGGLPLGVVTTVLKHNGVPLGPLGSSAQINPQTGQQYADAIPTTTKAHFQQGLTDLIGSMFSWPGRTVGIEPKTDVIQGLPGIGPLLKPDRGSIRYDDHTPAKQDTLISQREFKAIPVKDHIVVPSKVNSLNPPKSRRGRGGRPKHTAQPIP